MRPTAATTLMVVLAMLVGVLPAAPEAASTPVPTCPGFSTIPSGPRVWVDDHSPTSPLVTNIDRMICSAANHSTIRIKSWFIVVDGPAMRRLVADLVLMHRYHDVSVRVHVGRNWYLRAGEAGARRWRNFISAFAFARVTACRYSCRSTVADGSSHSKWVTVSQFRGGGSGVLSTSTNFSTAQFSTGQSGIFVARHPVLYSAFTYRFTNYETCAAHPMSTACGARATSAQPAATWHGGNGVAVYFAPVSTDPIAHILRTLHCTPTHRTINVMTMDLTRPAVVQALANLRAAGCAVRLLVEHPPGPAVRAMHPRCLINHNKTLIIDAGTVHRVVSGAESFAQKALAVNDNQMISTPSTSVRLAYLRYFRALWSRARDCS